MRKWFWIASVGALLLAFLSQGEKSAKLGNLPEKSTTRVEQTSQKMATDAARDNPRDVSPVLSAPQPVETSAPGTAKTKHVNGNRVALRSGPSTSNGIIDRLDRGRQVFLIEQKGEWSLVRDKLSQRDGWMASRFLSDGQRPPVPKPSQIQEKPPSAPVDSNTAIIQQIIALSVSSYQSSCACPYSTDSRGRRCGKRSAYSKPGGYSPICYPQDVSKEMIDEYRSQ